MKRLEAKCIVVAAAALGLSASLAPAIAAPPTATPSPGYDARLQQSRPARTVYAPVVSDPKPVPRRRAKRTHAH